MKYITLGARDFSCAVSGFGQVLKILAVLPLVSSAKGRRRVGLRPTKLLVTREKKSLVPREEIYKRKEKRKVPKKYRTVRVEDTKGRRHEGPKTRAAKPREFLRLDQNRKPRMKSLWHPG